jgi:hypothetical protein
LSFPFNVHMLVVLGMLGGFFLLKKDLGRSFCPWRCHHLQQAERLE